MFWAGESQPDFKPLTVGDGLSLPEPCASGFTPPEQGSPTPMAVSTRAEGAGLTLLHHVGKTSWLETQRGTKSNRPSSEWLGLILKNAEPKPGTTDYCFMS